MVVVDARMADGAFALTVEGHADAAGSDALCACITAWEQAALMFFEQLSFARPDQVQFTFHPHMEAIPS